VLALGLLAAGCSDGAASSDPLDLAEGPSQAPEPEESAEPPRRSDVTGIELGLEQWAGDERSRTLERYLAAVGQTVRDKVTSPLFLDSTSAQQMDDRRALAARAKDQGATVADTTLAYLADLKERDAATVAEVCVWGPSVAFLDERTGRPLRRTLRRWTPRSVTMTFVQQQWWVVDEARGRFACDKEAP